MMRLESVGKHHLDGRSRGIASDEPRGGTMRPIHDWLAPVRNMTWVTAHFGHR